MLMLDLIRNADQIQELLTQMLYDRIKLCCPQTIGIDNEKWEYVD